jgi:hypothetical protein
MNKDEKRIVSNEEVLLSQQEQDLIESIKEGDRVTPEMAEAISVMIRYYKLAQSNIYSEMIISLKLQAKDIMNDTKANTANKRAKNVQALAQIGKTIETFESQLKGKAVEDFSKMTPYERQLKRKNGLS